MKSRSPFESKDPSPLTYEGMWAGLGRMSSGARRRGGPALWVLRVIVLCLFVLPVVLGLLSFFR